MDVKTFIQNLHEYTDTIVSLEGLLMGETGETEKLLIADEAEPFEYCLLLDHVQPMCDAPIKDDDIGIFWAELPDEVTHRLNPQDAKTSYLQLIKTGEKQYLDVFYLTETIRHLEGYFRDEMNHRKLSVFSQLRIYSWFCDDAPLWRYDTHARRNFGRLSITGLFKETPQHLGKFAITQYADMVIVGTDTVCHINASVADVLKRSNLHPFPEVPTESVLKSPEMYEGKVVLLWGTLTGNGFNLIQKHLCFFLCQMPPTSIFNHRVHGVS